MAEQGGGDLLVGLKILRAWRTELDPTLAQRTLLVRHAGVSRWAYNWGLSRRIESYRETGRGLDAMVLHKELNQLKKTQFQWLYETSKCVPQEALRDLDRAFKNYWQAKRKGRRTGFPRFKARKSGRGSFRLTGTIQIASSSVRLPRLGWIRLKERDYLPVIGARILSATVRESAGHWFVSITSEQAIPSRQHITGPVVGVDLGISRWMTISDGTAYNAPASLTRLERRLNRAQRRLSRKRKASKNSKTATLRVARIAMRIGNIRRDALHKATTQLAKTKSVVVIEDLDVSAMRGHRRLARAISARSFATFRQMLVYKASWYGSEVVVAPRLFASTRRCCCTGCGFTMERLPLAQRVFVCDACGCSRDRDLNAALNLQQLAASSADIQNACGGDVRPPCGRQSPMKQESVRPSWTTSEERCSVSITPIDGAEALR